MKEDVSRSFHLGDILSISDGHLLSPSGISGVYDILNFMTGADLMTHQLPRASRECRPYLLQQHPELASVAMPEGLDKPGILRWLDSQIEIYGEMLVVHPAPAGAYIIQNPIEELAEMVPGKPIIVVQTS